MEAYRAVAVEDREPRSRRSSAPGSLSPVALVGATLDHIARLDSDLHSFICFSGDPLGPAKAAEASGEVVDALHGIPIGIKAGHRGHYRPGRHFQPPRLRRGRTVAGGGRM
ncbi:MAG TPA: hypothetical protein VGM32_12645 [Rhodopila sp.]|jgi:hypothetical protein